MGNSKSTRKASDLFNTSDTELGITVKIIDLNTNYTENLVCELVKHSKADLFTYFKVSNKLSKIINTDVIFNIELYKLGTDKLQTISIDKGYRFHIDSGSMNENVIDKIRYNDYAPNNSPGVILRHDNSKNLIKIIVRGNPFM